VSTASRHAAYLVEAPWRDDHTWESKLAADRRRADEFQTTAQRDITGIVVERAVAAGAEAVALTGSTARLSRTAISDLDYHIVGPRPKQDDLPGDVDIYVGDHEAFWRKLRAGDDFVQWTLRHGCLLVDTGIFRAGLRAIATEGLWPDPTPKLERLAEHEKLIARLLAMGDRDAAQAELRAALTSGARAVLLAVEVFPLARAELPEQLRAIGADQLGSALKATIESEPSLEDLRHLVDALDGIKGRVHRV
jgi:hypothetical protein